MKTFSEFVTMKENGILDVDQADDAGEGGGIMRALSLAADNHHSEVVSFLQRLAKQNSDIQIELDKLNHKAGQSKPSRKKPRMGSTFGHDLDSDGDVVVPNSADSSHGDMPGD